MIETKPSNEISEGSLQNPSDDECTFIKNDCQVCYQLVLRKTLRHFTVNQAVFWRRPYGHYWTGIWDKPAPGGSPLALS